MLYRLLSLLLFTAVLLPLSAQEDTIFYLQAPFETDLSGWQQTLGPGSLDVVDNPEGEGKVLRLVSVGTDQTFLRRNTTLEGSSQDTYYVEYDYRTENTDTRWDNMQLNAGSPGRLQFSLRSNTANYRLHDDNNALSETPNDFIEPNVWYHVKATIEPQSDRAQLSIDGKDFGFFDSNLNIQGAQNFLIKVLNGNTFYVDNLVIYGFGEAPPDPLDVELPVVPTTHPRVMAGPDDVATLRARFNAANRTTLRNQLLSQAGSRSDGELTNGRLNVSVYRAIEAKAFRYLIEGNEAEGRLAAQMATDQLRTLDGSDGNGSIDRQIHRGIMAAALAYDWCYDLLTPEQQTSMIADVKRLAATTEYGYPLGNDVNYLINHFGEEKVPYLLAFGIACHQEDSTIYRNVAGQLYAGLVPSRNWFYPSERHHQGSAYGIGRYEWEMFSTFLMTRMGADRPYVEEQRTIPLSFAYLRRPDGQLITEADDYNWDLPGKPYLGIWGAMMAASEWQDGYIQDEVERYYPFINSFSAIRDATIIMLIHDHELERRDISELPLTKHYGTPNTYMTARTGWDTEGGKDSPVAIATMNLNEYHFGNHDHLDAGHFNLYYKGPLAIDAGALSNSIEGPKFGGRSGHWASYYRRTIAHNTLTITDPARPTQANTTFNSTNEGGQEDKINPDSYLDLLDVGKHADPLAWEFGPDPITPDYSYLKGDLAKAYDSDRTPGGNKAEEVKRSFVFLNLKDDTHPAALLVYDRVTAREASFKKRWLLHSETEPAIDGIRTTIETRSGYQGKMVNIMLEPSRSNSVVRKIGGPGMEFWTESARPAAKNWDLELDSEIAAHEAGSWRVEISPLQQRNTDQFFNILQVMDKGTDPVAVTKISNDEVIGTRIMDRVVLFQKDGLREEEEVVVAIVADGTTVKYLLTDVRAGAWRVTGPGGFDQEVVATEEGGALYFTAPAGTYTARWQRTVSNRPELRPEAIKLFPNPADREVRVEGEVKSVDLFSVSGQRIEVAFDGSVLNVSQLPAGSYFLVVTAPNGGRLTKKLIVR